MKDLELAQLLCSRICHDLISPVGAISNGLEVLEDEDDPDLRMHALSLITQSATAASARLQYMRVAFGAGQSLGDHLSVAELSGLARAIGPGRKVDVDWRITAENLPRDEARLLLCLILVAIESLPRGGHLMVSPGDAGFALEAAGVGARLPEAAGALMAADGPFPEEPRDIAPYLAQRCAAEFGYALAVNEEGDVVRLTVTKGL